MIGPKKDRKRWQWLLVLPFIFLLWPAWYANAAPEVAGIPFFYWYQFSWIALTAVLTAAVYLLTRADA